MPAEVARRAVDLALARVSQRLHLVFFGGEPLLRWQDLVDFTRYARERASAASIEVKPTVTTNGTLLDDERLAWLVAERFLVAISCDGVRAAHDHNRKDAMAGSTYDLTIAAVRRCMAAGLHLRVVLVLDPSNVVWLPESLAALVAIGARELVVNINWAADWTPDSVRSQCQVAYQRSAELYLEAYRKNQPFWLSLLDSKIASHIKGGYLPGDLCDLGQRNLVVAASGRLYPCDRLVGEDRDLSFVLGDVWTGPDEQRIRQWLSTITLPPECQVCALAHRCRNRCACANLAMTSTIAIPSETLCFHEQLAIHSADRVAQVLFAERNPLFLSQHYPGGVC